MRYEMLKFNVNCIAEMTRILKPFLKETKIVKSKYFHFLKNAISLNSPYCHFLGRNPDVSIIIVPLPLTRQFGV